MATISRSSRGRRRRGRRLSASRRSSSGHAPGPGVLGTDERFPRVTLSLVVGQPSTVDSLGAGSGRRRRGLKPESRLGATAACSGHRTGRSGRSRRPPKRTPARPPARSTRSCCCSGSRTRRRPSSSTSSTVAVGKSFGSKYVEFDLRTGQALRRHRRRTPDGRSCRRSVTRPRVPP